MPENISGFWIQGDTKPQVGSENIIDFIKMIDKPVALLDLKGKLGVGIDGTFIYGENTLLNNVKTISMIASVQPVLPENLGDMLFKNTHNVRYSYIAGAMANGISSTQMVEAMGKAGMLGFFGAGGLTIKQIESAIDRLQQASGDFPFGFNLIHSPGDLKHEKNVVELYLKKGIKLISAAAYMRLTLPLVYYRVKGIYCDLNGKIVTPNKIIAKVSRIEVAKRFFSPPPEKFLKMLVEQNLITQKEAQLAKQIPMAEDLTAEADSGGHTDNRSALTLLPAMIALKNEYNNRYQYQRPLCVGMGGGIATPESAFAAFAMGAAYILTGSINQSCVEAATSKAVRSMLCQAEQADVTMTPAADMFEMGVKVQVLKRGTMFPQRATKLYDIYKNYENFYDVPESIRKMIEEKILKNSFENSWESTKKFFAKYDPRQIERGQNNHKYKMALVFRSYLGQASNWATSGVEDRKMDYQVWCGPAIGAFNEWVKGSELEIPENRRVATIAMDILKGASIEARINALRLQGVNL